MAVIRLPADTWTLAAPAGFGVAIVQPQGDQCLLFSIGAGPPVAVDTSAGGVISTDPVQQTIGTDNATFGLYLRPVIPGSASSARVL